MSFSSTASRRRAPRAAAAALAAEALESRRLFATFTVTTLAATGPGSLDQAVLDANAAAGADVITFQPDLVGDIDLGASPLIVTDDLDVQGPGTDRIAVLAGGDDAGNNRAFQIGNPGADLTVRIAGITMTLGDFNSGGGAVLNEGEDVTFDACVFDSNAALAGNGGAVLTVGGSVTVNNSTFLGNRADGVGDGTGGGGAIYVNGGSVNVFASTFDSNLTAGATLGGGAVHVAAGSLSVTNSTFSGNTEGDGSGGAIYVAAGAGSLIRASTFATNAASDDADGAGGAVFVAGSATLQNVLIGDNTAAGPAGSNDLGRAPGGTINATRSLIESMPDGTVNGTNNANIVGEDAGLDILGFNGGQNLTISPLPGSIAIDAGGPLGDLEFDQRGQGFPRTLGAAPDIGAFETEGAGPVTSQPQITAVSPSPVNGSDQVQTLTVTGVDFADTATVTLRNVTADLDVTDVTVTEITATRATLEAVFGNEPGTWSVEVTNPDGGTTGAFEFDVQTTPPTTVTIGDGQAKSVVFTDADGTAATLTLKGGTAVVTFGGQAVQTAPGKRGTTVTGTNLSLDLITLADTTSRSALTIKTKGGDGVVKLDRLTGSTPLGRLAAATTDLVGTGVTLDGAGTIGNLQLRTVAHNAVVDLPAAAAGGVTLKVGEIQGAVLAVGGAVKSLTATTFGGALTAASIGTVKVAGTLSAELRTAGAIRSVTAGTFSGARVLAGVRDDTSSLPLTSADFVTPTASIGSVSVKGKSSGAFGGGSLIAAPTVGKVSLGTLNTANDGDPFGVAVDSARSVTGTIPTTGKLKLSKLEQPSQTFTSGDFTVRVV